MVCYPLSGSDQFEKEKEKSSVVGSRGDKDTIMTEDIFKASSVRVWLSNKPLWGEEVDATKNRRLETKQKKHKEINMVGHNQCCWKNAGLSSNAWLSVGNDNLGNLKKNWVIDQLYQVTPKTRRQCCPITTAIINLVASSTAKMTSSRPALRLLNSLLGWCEDQFQEALLLIGLAPTHAFVDTEYILRIHYDG